MGEKIHGSIGKHACRCQAPNPGCALRAIQETHRWGEPYIDICCQDGFLIWGVPLTHNDLITGGLVVAGIPLEDPSKSSSQRSDQIHKASQALINLAIEKNLTNSSHLQLHKEKANREREKAEAIHSMKASRFDTIRELYLNNEPELLSAIKRGERKKAREIINLLLVHIYSLGQKRMDHLKSMILELIVMMSRAAVEAGAVPANVLGFHFDSITRLSVIEDEEDLSRWLCEMLEQIIDAIEGNTQFPNIVLLSNALKYIEEHLGHDLKRDEVAKASGLSPSHFSHLIKEKTGKSFTEMLQQYRIHRAQTLLTHTDKSLVQIAIECGFCDQSYFSKIFRNHTHLSPADYRKRGPSSR